MSFYQFKLWKKKLHYLFLKKSHDLQLFKFYNMAKEINDSFILINMVYKYLWFISKLSFRIKRISNQNMSTCLKLFKEKEKNLIAKIGTWIVVI